MRVNMMVDQDSKNEESVTTLVVIGMHRSGTSAMTGVLNGCGVWVGDETELMQAGVENPKGFWERRDIREICDKLLQSTGADWWKIAGFDAKAIPRAILAEQRKKFQKIMLALGEHGTWAIKEPRLCLLLPVLRQYLRNPVCIYMYRNPLEVARSLQVRNGFSISSGLALWEAYNLHALNASKGLPRIFVSFDSLMLRPTETVKEVIEKLAIGSHTLKPESKSIGQFIDPGLYRQRVTEAETRDYLLPSQHALWLHLRNDAAGEHDENMALSEATRQALMDLESVEVSFVHHHDANRALQTRIADYSAAQSARDERIRALKDAASQLETGVKERNERISALKKERNERISALKKEWNERISALKKEWNEQVSALNGKTNRLEKQLKESKKTIRESKKAINALHNSTSWKVTAPLRSISQTGRRWKERFRAASRWLLWLTPTRLFGFARRCGIFVRCRLNSVVAGIGNSVKVKESLSDRRYREHSVPAEVLNARVDIVVCVHNALADVKLCLNSVLSRTTANYRLIIVNDGSDEQTTEYLQQFCTSHEAVDLVETNGPVGYTRAANCGLRASRAEYVLLLNSDTIVSWLWLEGLLECMGSDSRPGIVGPLSNAASFQSVPVVTDADGKWAVNELPPGYNVDDYAELVYRLSGKCFPKVEFVNGFCFMISRQVIQEIGVFDEQAFPQGYGEENDYCLRARDAGFTLAVADHCFVFHSKSRSFGDNIRTKLAKQGLNALIDKYGDKRIKEDTAGMKTARALEQMRVDLAAFFSESFHSRVRIPVTEMSLKVLFVMPVRGGGGGAHSVVQETTGMRLLGVDAKVAIDAGYFDQFLKYYGELVEQGETFIFYRTEKEFLELARTFDVVIATLWSTPALIKPLADYDLKQLFMYYVQDYEPWFFPASSGKREQAFDSYTLIPGMAPIAKTDWICRTVRERHDVNVYRVTASLDHGVYYPSPKRTDKTIVLAAMLRPQTPRRAPLRTLRVFRQLVNALENEESQKNVDIVFFGCETSALKQYVKKIDSDFALDFSFENRGVLIREEVAELLREADVFADFSDYQAFGRTGLEAMACGCSVVLPAKGGADEYAVNGENALIVDTMVMEDMVNALLRLVTDPLLRQRLRMHGVKTARRYSIERASLSELAVIRAELFQQQTRRAPAVNGYGRSPLPPGGDRG